MTAPKKTFHQKNDFLPEEYPCDFDEDYYLKIYPHIAVAKIDPYFHFINYGKAEGRRASPYNLHKKVAPFCNTRETILLVSHDASRTGAPILALNIARELKKKFNLVILLLNGGALTPFFEQLSNAIISIDNSILSDAIFIDNLVNNLIEKYPINFSIVNSIESFWVLKPLAKRFIPNVLLIHEFSAYTRPYYKFSEAFHWAGTIVFPAKIVQENAINDLSKNVIPLTYVLSQGKSHLPLDNDSLKQCSKVKEWIKLISKYRNASKTFLILGAGAIHYRKGVDLFIATAAELKRSYPEFNIKMIWVGAGFDLEGDVSYSCYLAEQIERSNLGDSFELIDELSDLVPLYQQIDLFYLSSRLDPLPNVAIDVMMLGKPVICFDKGTGIAEILALDTITSECIVSHLSIIESTQKIIKFYQSPEYYSLVSSKIRTLARKYFNMENYISCLLSFLGRQKKCAHQEELDCLILESSIDFKEDFFGNPNFERREAIRKYIRSWHSKVNLLRKPAPGFNPNIYAIYHGCRNEYAEPFADYLYSEKPEGPWQEKIISPNSNLVPNDKELRCALYIPVFSLNFLHEILTRIQEKKSFFNVYISTNKSLYKKILNELSNFKHINYKLKISSTESGPLLNEFQTELQKYDVMGYFYIKKSIETNMSYRKIFLFHVENLLGGQYQMIDFILNEFKNNPKLGLVFADDPNLLDWGDCSAFAEEIARQLKLSNLPEHHFSFPSGNIFWARPEAIKPLFEKKFYLDWETPKEASVLNAIERLIPFITANQGFSKMVTHIPGLTL